MRNRQTPLATGWGPAATAEDVSRGIDFADRTVVVTGGASGLGLETTRVLAAIGADVIVGVRNLDQARTALDGIRRVEIAELELTDPASIDRFADEILASGRALDRVICNAGIMASPLFRDARGNEGQFSTNHLGHFRLVARLWPGLKAANAARVIVLSSRAHHFDGLDFDDLAFTSRQYDKWLAYGQSKTANALFAVALDARGESHGIRAYSLHPGAIIGPLARHLTAEEIAPYGAIDESGVPIIDPYRDMKTFAQGAATTVWCTTTDVLSGLGGLYCEDSDVAPLESEGRFGVRPFAVDPERAEALWSASVKLTDLDLA